METNSVSPVEQLRARIGRVGVQGVQLSNGPIADCKEAARRIEELGYGSLWIGENVGSHDVFAKCAILLAATQSITIGTGIANIWARAPGTAQGAATLLLAAWPDRFINGLGVSHSFAAQASGQAYGKPLDEVRRYLKGMDESVNLTPLPLGEESFLKVPRVIGAIGPKMTEIARDETLGAMPRFITSDYSRILRELLGSERLLIPEQAIVLEADPVKARAAARKFTSFYVGLPNYQRLLKAMGFTDADYENGGSDRLVDAIVAWGDADAIAQRIKAHIDAGADHVIIYAPGDGIPFLISQLERLTDKVLKLA